MVTSFKEATGDMVMYSFEFVFVLYLTLDEGKCQNMVRPADCGQMRAARGRWRSCGPAVANGPTVANGLTGKFALTMTHVRTAPRCGSEDIGVYKEAFRPAYLVVHQVIQVFLSISIDISNRGVFKNL